ncbi:MAG TPA: hypothetical protein VFZ98_00900 [Vicinamibacterales bacterium]
MTFLAIVLVTVLPEHFLLQPGERIHYTVLEQNRFVECTFSSENPEIVRLVAPAGIFEAVRPGRTTIVVHTADAERRFAISVAGRAQQPMTAVPHSSLKEIASKEFLFVGHANLDGFDYTGVAKPGIDRLVKNAKWNGITVVYWISSQYPDWYTTDRKPDYAIISEGQEHQIHVKAERVVFTGGSFMFCLLRNAQMTLHGMLERDAPRRIHFVFPARAIWVEDIWGPGDKRPYPAPMVLLSTLFARRKDDAQRYEEVVVPFLDRMITQFPVAGYPRQAPAPPLRDLVKDWTIVVRFGSGFERAYRRGDHDKTLLVEFEEVD